MSFPIEPGPNPPAGVYIQIIANSYSATTLNKDGEIISWPSPTPCCDSALGSGPFTQISAGSEFCALREDGSIACVASKHIPVAPYTWNIIWRNVLGTPSGSYVQVRAGGSHICALRDDGSAVCWGDNTYQKPGTFLCVTTDGFLVSDQTDCPALIHPGGAELTNIPGGPYEAVSVGSRHACAVKNNGGMACWGNNSYGQALLPSGPYQQLSSCCALKTNGSITCWQDGTMSDADSRLVSDIPSGPFVQVSCDRGDACAIRSDGSMVCWGYHYSETPVLYPTDGLFTQVSVGGLGACAVTTEGSIRCWESAPGTVKDNDGNVLSISDVPQGSFYTQVSPADSIICAIKNDGTIVCAGDNSSINEPPPGSYRQLSVGGGLCAIRDDGALVCWGTYTNGQGETVPYQPPVSGSFTQVSFDAWGAGCALRTNGAVVCWNHNGTSAETPVGTYKQIALDMNSCGIDTEGNVSCWKGGVYLPATL